MVRQLLKYTFIAVGAYLALAYSTQFGNDLLSVQTAYSGGVKTLQGRG